MSDRRFSRWCVLVVVWWMASGCGEKSASWHSGLHDLRNVPVSEALRPALEASIAALSAPESDLPSVRQYSLHNDLMVRIRPLETRAAAADELYSLWQAEPDNILWMSLARNYRTLINRPADLARMLNHPALSDTNTAIGAFTAGYTSRRRSERARWYPKAEGMQDQLAPQSRLQLVRKLAALDRSQGRLLAAAERLLAALPEARRVGGHALESRFWADIAAYLTAGDRLDDALHAATLAAAHARVADASYPLLQAQIRIASIMSQRGEYGPALDRLESYAEQGEELGYPWIVQDSLDKAAQISSEIGDYERALQLDRRILRHTQALEDRLNLPRCLASIAHDHRMSGRLDSTYVYLKRAQDMVAESGVVQNRSKIAELMAGYHCQVGNYALAESLLVAASKWNDTYNARSAKITLLLQMVPSALDMGRPDLAYEWLAQVAKDKASLAAHVLGLNFVADYEILSTRLLAEQGETRLAAEALERARLAVDKGGGEGKRWQLLAQEGELALQRQDVRQAEKSFVACLDLALQGRDPRRLVRSRFQLGQLYLDQGRFADAEAMFALLAGERTFGQAYRASLTSQLLLGVTYARQGQHARARQLFAAGLARLNPDSPADLVLRFHLANGQSLAALGQHAAADAELRGVLDELHQAAQLVRFDDLPVFHTDIARGAREALIGNALAGALYAADRTAVATLDLAYPGLAARLQKDADQGPALVFFLGQEASWSWLVTADQVRLRELPSTRELRDLITPILVDLGQPWRPVDNDQLTTLAATLMGELISHWPVDATLTLVLDGVLRRVPWAALPLPGGGDVVLDRGPLREIDPHHAEPGPRPAPNPSTLDLMAVGCDRPANSGGGDLPPLRQAEAEAYQIHRLWSGPRSALMTGAEANWPHLLASGLTDFGVIHLASHAEVHQGLPRRATLRLAAQTTDGLARTTPVTMAAISQLDLQADLVYLSSCQSGRPVGADGGVGDFTAAFLAAGARTIIASTQWVDDEAARYLAERFYDHWQNGAAKAAALQAARQDVRAARADWEHPAYWAFLRLVGDGS